MDDGNRQAPSEQARAHHDQRSGDDPWTPQQRRIRNPLCQAFHGTTLQSVRKIETKWEDEADQSPVRGLEPLEELPAKSSARSLWRNFLRRAAQGISINRLVCRWPTRIVRVDACPQGLGGYCLHSGIAWRYQLPEDLAGRATLNTLEFLAAFVGMVVEFRERKEWSPVRDVLLSCRVACKVQFQ